MDNESIKKAQEMLDEQWPGFEVKCKECGSTLVELENSMGYSVLSGSWGSLTFCCTQCANRADIHDA